MPLQLAPVVWPETLDRLRECGRYDTECVVFWTSSLDAPDRIDRVVHPAHTSTPFFYEVDSAWLTRLAVELYAQRRTVRLQVHTHAGRAFHSRTDDENPLITTPAFLSLVVPRFAREPVAHDELYLAELQSDGRWKEVALATRLEGLHHELA